jgi:hypothetical protein
MSAKLFLLAICSLFLIACNKSPTAPATKTDLITNKNWVMTSATINPGVNINGVVITDMYAQLPPCIKDNIMRFSSNGTYVDDEGATVCSAGAPQTTPGTWAFSPNETVVTMSLSGNSPESYIIESLTANSFVISNTSSGWGDSLYHKVTTGMVVQ